MQSERVPCVSPQQRRNLNHAPRPLDRNPGEITRAAPKRPVNRDVAALIELRGEVRMVIEPDMMDSRKRDVLKGLAELMEDIASRRPEEAEALIRE